MHLVAEPVEARDLRQHPARGMADARPGRGRHGGQRPSGGGPKRPRDARNAAPQPRGHEIARVAAEQLVAAVAGQGDGHMLPRQLRHQVRRDLRGIGEGLVVDLRKARDDRPRLLRGHVELGVLGTEVAGDLLRMLGLVVALLVEADGEGLHRPRRELLHQRHHGRRIDPAREEGAKRDVGDHLLGDGRFELLPEPVDRLVRGQRKRVGDPGLGDPGARPIFLDARIGGPGLERQEAARRKLGDAAVDRERRRDVIVAKQQRQRLAVDVADEVRMLGQRLELGAEQERAAAALPAVIERLLAEPVTGEGQCPLLPVPQGEGEHPGRALERAADAPGLEGREQRLRVRMAPPIVGLAGRAELLAQLRMIVDFAVEDDHVAATGRAHRLVAGGRQVEDREPVEGERRPAFGVGPRIRLVGAAVAQAVVHARQDRADVRGARPVPAHEPGDSAHQSCTSAASDAFAVPATRLRYRSS